MILATKKESGLHEYTFTDNFQSNITVKITRINEHAGVAEIIINSSNISTGGTFTCSETVEGKFEIIIRPYNTGYSTLKLENGSLFINSNGASLGSYTAAVIYD